MAFANGSTISFFFNKYPAKSSNDFCCKSCNSIPFDFTTSQIFDFGSNYTIVPQVLHFGDVNIDGYPDLLILLKTQVLITTTLPYIYVNTGTGKGQLQPSQQYNDVFSSVLKGMHISSVSFFDILENGIIDTFVSIKNSDENYTMYAFYNNYLYQNSFFLKGYGAIGPNIKRGSFLTGAVFYWVNSMDGSVKISTQSQCIQTSYDALQLPYVLSGLGRANNYVQSFTMANSGLKNDWSPIIPNSQLAVYSLPTSEDDWAINIYVLPTESLIYVIIVSSVILFLLGVALVMLKWKNYKKRPKIDDLIG